MIAITEGEYTREADIGAPRDLGRVIDGGSPPMVTVTLLRYGQHVISTAWRAVAGHADNRFPKFHEYVSGLSYCCECNEQRALREVSVGALLKARAEYDARRAASPGGAG